MTSLLLCPPLPPPPTCDNSGVFPPEVWILILEPGVVQNKDTYTKVARTCRTLNRIVTPFIWENVVLSRPAVYSFAHPPGASRVAGLVHVASACARTLKKHDDIASCVKQFTLQNWFVKGSVESSPDHPALEAINHTFDHVISAVLRCPNLHTLYLHNVQIPPRLHRALYHMLSLRTLFLDHCNISCRGETCAMNPQRLPIRHLRLCQTALSVHGYQHTINSIEALAGASTLDTLEIDAAIFDHLMNLYITSGIPSSLRRLRATPPMSTEVSGALLTDFLSLPGNPIQSLSLLRGFEGFVPDRVLPTALGGLREVAGPREVVMALVTGRSIQGMKIMDPFSVNHDLKGILQRLATSSLCPIATLGIKVKLLGENTLGVVKDAFPMLSDLTLEYSAMSNDVLESFSGILTRFVEGLLRLKTVTIVVEDALAGLDSDMLGEYGLYEPLRSPEEVHDVEARLPYQWGLMCPDLVQVTLIRDWGWRRKGVGYEWLKTSRPVETSFAF